MTPTPIPGTYGAIVRSTELWNWRPLLDQMLLTPERFNAFLVHLDALRQLDIQGIQGETDE